MEVGGGLKNVDQMSEQELREEVIRLRSLLKGKNDAPQFSESIKDEVRDVDSNLIDSMNLLNLNQTQKDILNRILEKNPNAIERITNEAIFLKTSSGNYEVPLTNTDPEDDGGLTHKGKNKFFYHGTPDKYFRDRAKLEPLSEEDIQSILNLIPNHTDEDRDIKPNRGDLLQLMGLSKEDCEGLRANNNGKMIEVGDRVGVYLGDRIQGSKGFSLTIFNGESGYDAKHTPFYHGIMRIIKKRKQAT